MAAVFLSYAREDSEFVRRLHDALAEAGREPAWDQDHEVVPFGSRYEDEIAAAITASDKFIFVISPASLASVACAWELATAQAAGKQVIPLLRSTVPDDLAIPEAAGKRNWIFFDDDTAFDRSLGQLIQALDTDLEWVHDHARLQIRAREWGDGGSDRSKLLRGSDLRRAEAWLAGGGMHSHTAPTLVQRQYITASRRATDHTTRTQRSVLAFGLAAALALAAFAFIQRNHAQQEATAAQARAQSADAIAELPVNPAVSLSEALASTRLNPSAQGVTALRLALAADSLRMAFNPGFGAGTQAVWDPVAQIIAATGTGNTVQLWNPRTGRLLRILGSLPPGYPVTQLLYNSAGTRLAAIAGRGMVAIWNTGTGEPVDLTSLNRLIRDESEPGSDDNLGVFLRGAWNPRKDDLYVWGALRAPVYASAVGPGSYASTAYPGPVANLVFSPSGAEAFAVLTLPGFQYKTVILRRAKPPITLATNDGPSETACWIPDGTEVAVWDPVEGQDLNLRIFSAQTGAPVLVRPEGEPISAAACGVAWRAGPHYQGSSVSYVAAGDNTGRAVLVQSAQVPSEGGAPPTPIHELTATGLYGHTLQINSVAVSPDGSYAATGSADGTVRIWDALTGQPVNVIVCGKQAVEQVQFSPDGGLVLAVGADGVIQVADAGTGEPAVPLQLPAAGQTYTLGFVDEGQDVYGINEITSPSPLLPWPQTLAVTALVWNAATGKIAASYRLPAPPAIAEPATWESYCPTGECEMAPGQEFTGLTVSPDGTLLAYAAAGQVVIRELRDGATFLVPVPDHVTGLAFASPSGALVIMTDASVLVWRPHGGISRIPQKTVPGDAELDATANLLATADASGTATVWDVRSGRAVATITPARHPDPYAPATSTACHAIRVALSPAGAELAIGTACGTVDLWRFDSRHVLVESSRLSNPVTPDEFLITELRFNPAGTTVLAADYPQRSAGFEAPAGTAVLLSSQPGGQEDLLRSDAGEIEGAAINPGLAVSPDGQFVASGVGGFAPVPAAAGNDAIYSLTDPRTYLNLQNSLSEVPVVAEGEDLAPVDPWAPDGVHLIDGAPAVYACDACGSLAQLQAAAALRLAWAETLTQHSDHPASSNAFF